MTWPERDEPDLSWPDLDPRWQWREVREFGGAVFYVKGPCNHLETVPVTSILEGCVVAHLCRTCDTQLPVGFKRSP